MHVGGDRDATSQDRMVSGVATDQRYYSNSHGNQSIKSNVYTNSKMCLARFLGDKWF